MTLFAKLDKNNMVLDVIVSDKEFIQTGKLGDVNSFVELIDNEAGKGFTYDVKNGKFIGIKPYNSWVLNSITYKYEAPVPMPIDEFEYRWDEELLKWVKLDFQNHYVLKVNRLG